MAKKKPLELRCLGQFSRQRQSVAIQAPVPAERSNRDDMSDNGSYALKGATMAKKKPAAVSLETHTHITDKRPNMSAATAAFPQTSSGPLRTTGWLL